MDRETLTTRVRNGLFISSMMHTTDGAYVAERGHGADMVQIGALIADPLDTTHDPKSMLPCDQRFMESILRRELEVIRQALGDTPVGLNAAPGDRSAALRMARALHAAGGDIFELNCHGGYKKLLDRGLLQAMALAENRATMIDWLTELVKQEIPIVVKFNSLTEGVDFREVLKTLEPIDRLFGVHFNVRQADRSEPDLDFVRTVRPHVHGVLFCSGYVTTRSQVEALIEAGADCVGIAQGVMDEPQILAKLAGERP